MAEQQEQRTTKIQINELNKFVMFASCPGSEGKLSKLCWCIRDGNPRITVYTNDPKDTTNYGVISAPMNPESFFGFLDLFEEIVNGEPDRKQQIESYTSYKNEAGIMGEKILMSELWFGKDSNKIIWMALVAPNRPKIKFEFKVSDYHKIFHSDGSPFSEADGSYFQFKAVLRFLRSIYPQLCSGFRQPFNKGFNQQQQKPSSPLTEIPFEDDLPF